MKKYILEMIRGSSIGVVLSAVAFIGFSAAELLLWKSNALNAAETKLHSKSVLNRGLAKVKDTIEPVDTCKSLPLTSLVCATHPTSELVVNVKTFGAKGDGKTDDTKAIQKAVNGATGANGTILVPAGTYLINAEVGIRLGNDMTFRMEEGAVLKAIPNDKESSDVLMIKNANNVTVLGGIIKGDRILHKGKTGEWGMGIRVTNSSNVVIENVISKDNWGDGFYVNQKSQNIRFCGVIADNNRRHGLAIVSADGIVVKNSTFQRGNGYVGGGIDIEPNEGEIVQNYEITHSTFIFNESCGITSSVPEIYTGKSFVLNGLIDNNLMAHNGKPGGYTAGILISQQKQIKVTNNIVRNNLQNGILVAGKSQENLIKGNTITNNGNTTDKNFGAGIYLDESTDNQVENNKISGSTKADIYDDNSKNILRENAAAKIHLGHSPI